MNSAEGISLLEKLLPHLKKKNTFAEIPLDDSMQSRVFSKSGIKWLH